MARKSRDSSQPQIDPTLAPQQAVKFLRGQIDKGELLLDNRPITSAKEQSWETVTRDILIRTFGSSSPNVSSVMDVGRYAFAFGGGEEQEWEQQRAEDMETRLVIIDGLIEMLESQLNLENSDPSSKPTMDVDISSRIGNNVFLVHGHDEAGIHQTARFLEGLDLKVTILREQPNSGRTIIEKFIDYSDTSYAVVLLTADDRGGIQSASFEEQNLRARQNVILELGFFLGKLGRKHVCVLYQEGVEIPSDYKGVLFVPLDKDGAWRFTLARELKAAGLEIDLNKAV